MVGLQLKSFSEWTSEGNLNEFSLVGIDGFPSVINRVRITSTEHEWVYREIHQFGWYRRSSRFCPMVWGQRRFFIT